MDNLTKEQRRLNMSRIRSTGTKLEQDFFELLENYNIPYIKYPKLYGKPDCQIGDKTLVFVDSDFWHGWRFNQWRDKLPQHYWVSKIERNIKRDKHKFLKLKRLGYRVIRIWSHELKNPNKIMLEIEQTI